MNWGGAEFRPESRAMHPHGGGRAACFPGTGNLASVEATGRGRCWRCRRKDFFLPTWGPMELRSIPPAYDYKHFDVPFGQLMWVHETEFTRPRGLALWPCPLGTS